MLVVINVIVYLAQVTLVRGGTETMAGDFGLNAPLLEQGEWWRLFTHQFIHGNTLHLVLNMAVLWFAGLAVEGTVGSLAYTALYLCSGVLGGLLQIAVNSQPEFMLIGASGSVCGVLLAFCTLYPNVRITALIFFILPLKLKAKFLGMGIVGITVAFWLSGLEPNIGHLAHLGGCLGGFVFGLLFQGAARRANLVEDVPQRVPVRRSVGLRQPMDPAMAAILDKISREGFSALDDDERGKLEKARDRFLNRPDP